MEYEQLLELMSDEELDEEQDDADPHEEKELVLSCNHENCHPVARLTETSPPADIQGIDWTNFGMARGPFRQTRMKAYRNHFNAEFDVKSLEKDILHPSESNDWQARAFTRKISPHYTHFQLRHLVRCSSFNDIFALTMNGVSHWNPSLDRITDVLNYDVVPIGFNPVSMFVHDDFLYLGGYTGELYGRNMSTDTALFATARLSNALSNIVNAITKFPGLDQLLVSNNDNFAERFDMETMKSVRRFQTEWPINHAMANPDGKLICLAGDCKAVLVIDSSSGKEVATLNGHLDFSFGSSWHPGGLLLATGNQDLTARVWDTRKLTTSVACLGGRMAAIRSVEFSPDGMYLGFAEAADFVHFYDVGQQFQSAVTIDCFGDISGFAFAPDSDAAFFGVTDRQYGAIIECTRSHSLFDVD